MVQIGIINPRVGVVKSGGTETFLREMMKRLSQRHNVICYTGTGGLLNEVKQMDIQVVQIDYFNKDSRINQIISSHTPLLPAEIESFSLFWNVWRGGMIKQIEQDADVVSTHYYLDNIFASRLLSLPVIFRCAGIKSPSWRWKAMDLMARPTLSIANSRSTAYRLEKWLDLKVDGVVYPGVNIEQFTSECEPAFEDNQMAILYVGRIDEGKGLRELLAAHSQLSDVELYLVGDGALMNELRKKTHKLETNKNVHFVGPVPHEEIHRYYSAADIFCLPSYHESLGIVNLEAMASGCPVVSTHIDAIEEYIHDEHNGLLVEPGDIGALTTALRRLIKNKVLRQSLARAGQETVLEYGWDAQSGKLEEYYVKASQR